MDLSTMYLGMRLKNPIVPSSSPLSMSLEGIKRLEESGASAVVMYSLFEEQITRDNQYLDHFLSVHTESYAEALSYFPDLQTYNAGPEDYLNLIRKAKESVSIPVIASLNGISSGGWIEYATMMEQAGADAIELNIYYIPTDIMVSSTEVETMYLDVVRDVRRSVKVPLAVKVSPHFTSMAHMAKRLWEVGADGLVMFNRFYQPDIDIEKLEVVPHLVLSQGNELRLPLRWAAILHGRVPLDMAITTGVHTYEDVLRCMLAGARVSMMASELLMHGPGRISEILADLERWMEEHEYESITQMQGSMSHLNVAEPAAFERANYMKVLQSFPRGT